MAAMMAGEAVDKAMFDHPGGAIGALDAVAAGAAERQRRKAATVEEQQALFALAQPVGERVDERRREPAAAIGWVAAHVDRVEVGQRRAAIAGGQDDVAIAAGLDHREAFERRSRAREDHRQALERPAHHRDVARVIVDAILLLEAGFVRLVDDDRAEVGIGQEQRRARADDDLRFAACDRMPGAAALGRAQAAVPRHRLAAEARRETREHGFGERDFGKQDERLLARVDRSGDRFHIDFGLARPGDAVEEQRLEPRRGDGLAQLSGRGSLFVGQIGRGEGRIGFGIGGVGRDFDRFERARLHEAADHRVADLAKRREFANRALPRADPFERHRALRRHPCRQVAGRTIFDDRAARVGEGGAGQHHAQHRAGRREIIVARPFDETAQRRPDRRNVDDFVKIAEAIVADGVGRAEARVLPHHAAEAPRPERRDDDAAERRLAAIGYAIVERAEGGGQKEDASAGHGSGRI